MRKYWCLYFLFSISLAHAQDLNIDHPLSMHECDYTKDRSAVICMGEDGKYKISQLSKPSSKNAMQSSYTSEQKSLLGIFHTCLVHEIAKENIPTSALLQCINPGIIWCNKTGMKTSEDFKVSPVSGRIIINNQQCAYNLEAEEHVVRYQYNEELQNFLQSEGAGYTPLLFDIRTVAWGWK